MLASDEGDPLDRAVTLHQEAAELRERRHLDEAEKAAREALTIFASEAGDADPDVANVANLLAGIRAELDDLAEAEALSRRAVDICTTFPSGEEVLDQLRVQSERGLGHVLRGLGRHDEAAGVLQGAVELAREHLGADDSDTIAGENELAILYKYTGRFDEAEALCRPLPRRECGAGLLAVDPDRPDTGDQCGDRRGPRRPVPGSRGAGPDRPRDQGVRRPPPRTPGPARRRGVASTPLRCHSRLRRPDGGRRTCRRRGRRPALG